MVNMVMAYRPPWSTVYIQLWPTADRPVLGSIQVKDDMQGDHGSLAPDTMGIAD